MKSAKPYLQVAALASAVLCVGAFVAYRAGAFPARSPSPPAQAAPPADAANGGALLLLDPADANGPTPADPTFLSGSKSLVIARPPVVATAPPKPTPAP